MQTAAPELAGHLRAIRYSSSLIVNLAYSQIRAPKVPAGFGVLIPRRENRRARAITFVHQKFTHRAIEGGALLRVFLGGTSDEGILQSNDAAITAIVRKELQEVLHVFEEPSLVRIFRWPKAMAQYGVDHRKRVELIEVAAASIPSLALAGNAYHGIGIPDCIRSGRAAARRLLECKK